MNTIGDPAGAELHADVCVIGAGPVGLAVAHALCRTRSVVLLESARDAADQSAQELNDAEIGSGSFTRPRAARFRAPGGTAHLWNTEVDGRMYAKYLPLEPIDFEARDAVPLGEWPLDRAALEPAYRAAHELLRLGPVDYDEVAVAGGPSPLETGPALENRLFRLGVASRFTSELPRELERLPGVTVLRGATAVEPAWRDARLHAIRWRSSSGAAGTVRARDFVLAAGAIENARLLLVWCRPESGGPPAPDWLGHGLMEHPIDATLDLITSDERIRRLPGFYSPHDGPRRRNARVGALVLSTDSLRACALTSTVIRIVPADDTPPPRPALVRRMAARAAPYSAIARRAAPVWFRPAPMTARVMIYLEQGPHYENRVRLSSRTDALGLPRAVVDWRWNETDDAHRERHIELVTAELEAAGAGTIRAVPGRPPDTDTHHHAGTTRMHPDPRAGVVDENMRVHGTENVYVAGASVFPSAGAANPTLTAIALGLRLAEHLAGTS